MKRLLVFALCLFGIFFIAAVFIPFHIRWLSEPFKKNIEKDLSRVLPYPVTLGHIRYVFFNRAIIDSVIINEWSPEGNRLPSAKIDRLTISFNIFSFLFNRHNPLKAISTIKLSQFDISVPFEGSTVPISFDKEFPDIYWEKGTIHIVHTDPVIANIIILKINDVEGKYISSLKGSQGYIDGMLPQYGRMHIEASIDAHHAWHCSMNGLLQHCSFDYISQLMHIWGSPVVLPSSLAQTAVDGDIILNASAHGIIRNTALEIEDWDAEVSASSTTVTVTRDDTSWHYLVDGRVLLNNRQLDITHASLNFSQGTRITCSGNITGPFSDQAVNLTFHAAPFVSEDFYDMNVIPSWVTNLHAQGIVTGTISGTLTNPAVEMAVDNGTWRSENYAQGNCSFQMTYHNNNWRLSNVIITTFEGVIRGEAFSQPKHIYINASCVSINLSSITSIPAEYFNGILNGSLTISGDPHNPELSGVLTIDKPVFFNQTYEQLPCSVYFKNNRFVIDGSTNQKDLSLFVDIKKNKQEYILTQGNVVSKTFLLKNAGVLRDTAGALNVSMAITDMPMNTMPFKHAMPGTCSFNGVIQGTLLQPLAVGKISCADGAHTYATAEISCDREELRCINIRFLDAITGSAVWQFKTGELSMKVKEDMLDILRVKNFFNLPIAVEGTMSGVQTIARKKNKNQRSESHSTTLIKKMKRKLSSLLSRQSTEPSTHYWETEIDITLENGIFERMQFETFTISALIDQTRALLSDFYILQKTGSMRGKGEISFRAQEDNVSFIFNSKHWSWNNLSFDGEVTVNGDYVTRKIIDTQIYSPSIWFNGQNTGVLKGKISFINDIVQVYDVSLGKFLSGTIAVNTTAPVPTLDGIMHFNLDNLKYLKELIPSKALQSVNGRGYMTLSLSNTIVQPVLDFDLKIPEAQWNGKKLEINGTMHYADKTWRIPGIIVDCYDKGRISLMGSYTPTDTSLSPDINAQLKHVDFSIIRSFVPLPQLINGAVDGVISITGMQHEPTFSGTLSGGKTKIHLLELDGWNGDIVFKKNQLNINKLTINRRGELWSLREGSYIRIDSENQVNFLGNIEVRNFYIGKTSFFGGVHVRGMWDFTKKESSGIEIVTNHLFVNQHDFERVVIPISIQNNVISFTPIDQEPIVFSGTVRVSSYPVVQINNLTVSDHNKTLVQMHGIVSSDHNDFWFKTNDTDGAIVCELLGYEPCITGVSQIYCVMSGSFDDPRMVYSIQSNNGTIARIPYDVLRIHGTYRDGIVTIDVGEINALPHYAITLNGVFPLPTEKQEKKVGGQTIVNMSLHIAPSDVSILAQAIPSVRTAKGSISGQVDISGSLSAPHYEGVFMITEAHITSHSAIPQIKNVNGKLIFHGTTCTFESCTARIGEGVVDMQGTCTLGFMAVNDIDLKISSNGKKGIYVEAPFLAIQSSPLFKHLTTTSRGHPRVDIRLTGSFDAPRIYGTFNLDDTYFTYPPSAEFKKNLRKSENSFVNFIKRAVWDVTLIAGNNTWYENEYANTQIVGKIRISNIYPDLKVEGKITTGKGSIGFLGTQFNVKNAELEMIPLQHEPVDGEIWENATYLEGTAETEVYYTDQQTGNSLSDTITLVLDRARVENIKPRFISRNNPHLTSEKALERATGYETDVLDPRERDALMRKSIIQILDATLTTPIARNIVRKTGIVDTVRITHETLPSEDTTAQDITTPAPVAGSELREAFLGTKYIVGKQLASNLLLEYSMQIIGSSLKLDLRHELELSYRLKGNTYIRGIADLNQPYSGLPPERKAIIEKQWRFNWPTNIGKRLKEYLNRFRKKE